MISLLSWVIVRPLAIVYRNLHFCRVSVVHVVTTPIVLVPPEVLWIIHIWIVHEALIITLARSAIPGSPVGLLWLLCLCTFRCRESSDCSQRQDHQGFADHNTPPGYSFIFSSCEQPEHRQFLLLELKIYSLLLDFEESSLKVT